MYGSIISATDCVAIVALLKDLGTSRRLITLIEGEAMLNDGTAMVAFLILLDIVQGNEATPGQIIAKAFRLSGGGPLFGLFGGIILSFILRRINNNSSLEINTTLFVSYTVYFVAEYSEVQVCGVLAIVAMGLYMTNTGKIRNAHNESEHAIEHIWDYIGFLAESMIFIIGGIMMGDRFINKVELEYIDYLKLIGTYVILHAIRFLLIFICWPILSKLGNGMSLKQVFLTSYAGIRGAFGICLALMVANTEGIPRYSQNLILLHTIGVALLT